MLRDIAEIIDAAEDGCTRYTLDYPEGESCPKRDNRVECVRCQVSQILHRIVQEIDKVENPYNAKAENLGERACEEIDNKWELMEFEAARQTIKKQIGGE